MICNNAYDSHQEDRRQLFKPVIGYDPSSSWPSRSSFGRLSGSEVQSYAKYKSLCGELLGQETSALPEFIIFSQVRSRSSAESVVAKFANLKARWKAETSHFSLMTDKAMHPAYQQIIGMGKKAIPLILKDLQNGPDHWFWALTSLTGVDPVQDSHLGDIELMTNDWIDWGISSGYIS